MSNVIDLSSRRRRPKLTARQVIEDAIEDIQQNWEKFARMNRLNDYFISCTPSWTNPNVNYLEDLTAVAVVESKIRLQCRVTSAEFSPHGAFGWTAAFRVGNLTVETPPMATENYARCFNILLFLKVKRDLLQNDL